MKKFIGQLLICSLMIIFLLTHSGLCFADAAMIGEESLVPSAGTDGQIGSIDHSGTGFQLSDTGIYHQNFITTTAGPINYFHYYTTNGGDICVSIHNLSGTNLASASGVCAVGWTTFTLNTEVTLSTATTYYLCVQENGATPWVEHSSSGTWYYDIDTYACPLNFTPESNSDTGGILCLYVDNNSGDPE